MKCENCNNDHNGVYGSGRFCSSKCARGFSTKGKRKEINNKVSKTLGGSGKINNCLNCNSQTRKNKFCSLKCKKEYEWEQYCKEVEKNNKFINIKNNAQIRKAKKFLLFINGNKCEICGITNWNEKPLTMIMDHIDGNGDNWNLKNLRLICPNCDHQLPTFGSRNYGNGNKLRREKARKKYHYIQSLK